MNKVEVNNLTALSISENFLKKIGRKVLEGEGRRNFELSIVLVGQRKMREFNRRYRMKDAPTDVLSFFFDATMGEIVICPDVIRRNAKKYTLSFDKELEKVLVHGTLHLLGYDHERSISEYKKMRSKEQKYIC